MAPSKNNRHLNTDKPQNFKFGLVWFGFEV